MSDGVLIPRIVFVGDEAEFLYPVSKLENCDLKKIKSGNFSLTEIKQNENMVVTGFEIKEKSNEMYVSVKFIPWDTGELSFPSFTAFGILTELPKIKISSILEKTNTNKLQPIRPPLLVPGTRVLIFGLGFAILFAILISLVIGSVIKKRFTNIPASVLKKRRVKKINKALSKLKRGKKHLKNNDIWLKEYEISLREYIASLTVKNKNNTGFYALTYNEIADKINTFFNADDEAVVLCNKLFQMLELFRYARNQKIEKQLFDKTKNDFLLLAGKFITASESAVAKSDIDNKKNGNKIKDYSRLSEVKI
ncbi:MAG: hypothetical protein CR988_04680 [Treponema sp.]|nr:MAG: hypothetical protein CR988_04680 [Treponema sp.]